ncbi:hypothetical protein G9A89_000328 [Geosiphon pyriformis]|nr:hypothetical protein G9A89_000328 [Geosiphon pyriformis]
MVPQLSRNYCPECFIQLLDNTHYCQQCQVQHFKENFDNWTSGSQLIDEFIRETQLDAKECNEFLEFIPFNSFINVFKYDVSEVGTTFTANWVKGPADSWDSDEEKYVCKQELMKVALTSLGRSDVSFLQELKINYRARKNNGLVMRVLGVTRESVTGNFMMVAETVEWDLRHYLSHHFVRLTWRQKLAILHTIACGLENLHNLHDNIIREDITRKNNSHILKSHLEFQVNELGLGECKDFVPVVGYYRNDLLPLFAPEILYQGKTNSKESEVYSFAMLMWELASNRPPFYNTPHDAKLVVSIANGLRPRIPCGTPSNYVELMKSCWDTEPRFRPNMSDIVKTLSDWYLYQTQKEIFEKAEKIRVREILARGHDPHGKMLNPLKIHPQAIYTSHQVKIPILPMPKNRPKKYYEKETYQPSILVRDESFFISKSILQHRDSFPEAQPEPEIEDEDLQRQYELALDFNTSVSVAS